MRILVTNDDGISSEGLIALTAALSRLYEVWILAPDKERSGASHGLTLGAPCRIKRVGDRSFSCSGTPSDCVVLAMLGAIGPKPDLVVSGINHGPNLGTDIVYSGTCAAAREAVLSGIPGIAVSCVPDDGAFKYGAAAAFVDRNLGALISACTSDAFVNVNAPSSDDESLRARWCPPCSRIYGNELESFRGPDGSSYCFITGGGSGVDGGSPNDFSVVAEGMIALSAIVVRPQVPSGFVAEPEFL
jgi:5'-nucleotidase